MTIEQAFGVAFVLLLCAIGQVLNIQLWRRRGQRNLEEFNLAMSALDDKRIKQMRDLKKLYKQMGWIVQSE